MILGCVVVAAVVLATPAVAADLPAIKERGTLRVIVEPDALPELYAPQGTTGMEREVLDGFARLHGLRIETVRVPFEERLGALAADRGDVVAGGLVESAGRREKAAFTEEVLPTRLVVVRRKPAAPVTDPARLRELKVAVPKGGAAVQQLLSAGVPRANIVELPSETLIAEVIAGRAEAAVLSTTWAILEQRRDPAWQLGTFLGPPTAMAFAVRKEDAALRGALDDYISNLRRTPTWSRLVVKYFGESAKDVLARARE